jgi:hypothetical protein
MKHRIYIDEVGNSDLGSSDNPNHRYLSLTGVIIELDYVRLTVQPALEALKARFFSAHPDEPLVLHRREIVRAQPPFQALADDAVRAEFDEALLAFLSATEFSALSVCLDKKRHRETYNVWHYDPYHYCLAILLERFVFFLDSSNSAGDVMAESRGGKEDMRLKAAYRRIWAQGTDYVAAERFQRRLTSKELKVSPKAHNVAGLQVADLVAHTSRDEMLHDCGVDIREAPPFAARLIALLQRKYYRRGNTLYGKKVL